MGIGDWGLGIGDWAQALIANHQFSIPIKQFIKCDNKLKSFVINYPSKHKVKINY